MNSNLNNHAILDLLFPANPHQHSLANYSTPSAAKRLVDDIKNLIPKERKIGVNDFYLFLPGNPSKPAIVKVLAQSLASAKKATADELWNSYSEALQNELRPILGTKCPSGKKVEEPPPKKVVTHVQRRVFERKPSVPAVTIIPFSDRVVPKEVKPASTFPGWNTDQKERIGTNESLNTKGFDVVRSRPQPLSYSTKRWSLVVMNLIGNPFQKYIAEVALEEPLELQVPGTGLFGWTQYVINDEETIMVQKAMEKLQRIPSAAEVKTWPPEVEALKEMFNEHFAHVTKTPYITKNKKLLQYFGSYVKEE